MSKEYYESKNQNIVPTKMLFEIFNKIPNRKEGNSEMGMDEYEQKNLATILEKLNKAEAENKRMEKVLVNTAYRNVDGASLERMIQKMVELGLEEIQVSFRMGKHFDE